MKIKMDKRTELKETINSFVNLLKSALKGEWKGITLTGLGPEYRELGESINKTVETLQEHDEEVAFRTFELNSAISTFSKVLSSTAKGDLTAKVDLSLVSEEYKQIGKDINKMISVTEHNITELRKREEELTSASCDVTEIMEITRKEYQKITLCQKL
jgi:hypothetical protein